MVIPVKDDSPRLRRCLEGLVGQTRRADEIVVVDNGSRDDSATVALAFGARVVDHPGGGIPAASAAGYDSATGAIIARLDADCVPAPDWLERIEQALDTQPGVAAITGAAVFIDGPRALRQILAFGYLGSYFVFVGSALGHAPLFGSNFAMRRSAWSAVRDSVHRDDPLVHDDMDLSVHLGRRHVIRYERRLGMGVSMRPFGSASSMQLRARRGLHSLSLHWPEEAPWRRWASSTARAASGVTASATRNPSE